MELPPNVFKALTAVEKSEYAATAITMANEAHAPSPVPQDWLQVRTMGNVLAFVDSRFKDEKLRARVALLGEDVRRVDAEPMGLRSIFTTLARASRDAAV